MVNTKQYTVSFYQHEQRTKIDKMYHCLVILKVKEIL